MITLRLTQSIFEIQNNVNKAIAKEFNSRARKKKSFTLGKLKSATSQWISSTDEINSLMSSNPNELRSYFGVTDPQSAVNAIVESVVNSVEIEIIKFDNKLKGAVKFNFQPQDNLNLLSLPEGHQTTENGADLHWLDWLLMKGDSVVVVGYRYTPDRNGRTGVGSMEKGGTFRVDPRYSGTIGNNFVSRAFIGREEQVVKIIQESLL